MPGRWLYQALLAISAITIASGLGQLIKPELVLGVIGGESTATSRHFFGIIGMFMLFFGAMLLQALLTAGNHSVAVLWAGVQKAGAAIAVGIAVAKGLFSPLALGVAGFDLVSAILVWMYYRRNLDQP